jgi:hypothetical protein
MKVYWSGAAIALLADIELRQRSGGTESLDTVLGQLQSCCLPARTQWSGQRLFKKLDSFLEAPVFMPLYEQYANTEGFPDYAPALVDLGIDVSGSSVTLRENRPLAGIRQAISALQ